MEVDTDAPAVAKAEIEVDAEPEIVWSLLTVIGGWPSWNPDVSSATLEGPFAGGTRFRWKAGPGRITSTLQEVEPPHLVSWTGTTLGIRAIHVHRLERRASSTLVRSEESWSGPLVRLLRGPMKKTLQKSVESGLRHLKVEAERRAAAAD